MERSDWSIEISKINLESLVVFKLINSFKSTILTTKLWTLSSLILILKKMINKNKMRCFCATAINKVYQLLAQGRWFSPGTPASSTTKTGRHNIAEILLKVG
jgi:hypothetical protein